MVQAHHVPARSYITGREPAEGTGPDCAAGALSRAASSARSFAFASLVVKARRSRP